MSVEDEMSQLRREVSSLTSAVKMHTREFEEQMLSVRCCLSGIIVVLLLGILVGVVFGIALT